MINGGPELRVNSTTVFLCYSYSLKLKWVLKSADLPNAHNKWSLGQVGECWTHFCLVENDIVKD